MRLSQPLTMAVLGVLAIILLASTAVEAKMCYSECTDAGIIEVRGLMYDAPKAESIE